MFRVDKGCKYYFPFNQIIFCYIVNVVLSRVGNKIEWSYSEISKRGFTKYPEIPSGFRLPNWS